MSFMKRRGRALERGQSLVEYVMLLAMIAGMGKLLHGVLPEFLKRFEEPLRSDFARTYKYGDPKACGYENDPSPCSGSPEKHPRYYTANSARMFARGSKK